MCVCVLKGFNTLVFKKRKRKKGVCVCVCTQFLFVQCVKTNPPESQIEIEAMIGCDHIVEMSISFSELYAI